MAERAALASIGSLRGINEDQNHGIVIALRTALQNAASIAGLMITTEAMVAEAPKKDDGGAGGHGGGGMGGMGGMDF